MRFSEARDALLTEFRRTTLHELRQQWGRLYPTEEIARILAGRVGGEVEDYVRRANRLVMASLEASLDEAIARREREAGTRRFGRRRRTR